MGNGKKDDNELFQGCLLYGILAMFIGPILGLMFIGSDNQDRKILGWILLVVGIILWCMYAAFSI